MPASDPDDLANQILAVSIQVFGAAGTHQVTIDGVAREAGVPTEEVAARWPTTISLLTASIERLTDDLAAAATCEEVPTRGSELTAEQSALLDQVVGLVARALVDRTDPGQLQGRFPMIDQLIEQFVASGTDLRTARYRAFQLLVVEFGARLFSGTVLAACGLEDESPSQVRAEIDSLQDLVAIRAVHPAEPRPR